MEIDIKHLEFLSKLKISEEKQDKFKDDFIKVLNFVDEITKLQLPEDDKTKAVNLADLREDETICNSDFDALLNAPCKKDNCFKVPRVVE